jgi:integrase
LSFWAGRRVHEITRRDVTDLLDRLAEQGPIAANRAFATLRAAFAWRVNHDSATLAKSPCDGVQKPSPEVERERVLSDAEIRALWGACDSDGGHVFGPLVKILLLTGCRRDEVRLMAWSEIDLTERKLTLSATRVKTGNATVVPLSPLAVDVIRSIPRVAGSRFVFTTNGVAAFADVGHATKRLRAAVTAELGEEPEPWVLHDLRRTFATGLQRLGFPQEVTEAALNHRSGTLAGVAGVYSRHDYADEKRAALDSWARHVEAIVSGEKAKVIPMQRGRR